MRKVLYAGISAFALALAFGGSSAWANPFEESVIKDSSVSIWGTNAACDNCGNSDNAVTNANKNSGNANGAGSSINQFRNETVFSKVTVIESDQNLWQNVSNNYVRLEANGGDGGDAFGGDANPHTKAFANGGSGGSGGETEAERNNSSGNGDNKNINSDGGDGGSANGGVAVAVASAKGGKATGGGGGGGGTIVAGNVTAIVGNSAGLFNQQYATLSSGAQGGVNFSAFANINFGK